jgi:hypothetical protein
MIVMIIICNLHAFMYMLILCNIARYVGKRMAQHAKKIFLRATLGTRAIGSSALI